MQQRCIKNWVDVSRAVVAQRMRNLDPVGVDARQRRALRCHLYYEKSSIRVWHLDGYDKFKLYGFEIHGYINGYSGCDQIKTQKKYATFLLIIWPLLKEFHGKLNWSWDGERSYNRLSKIPQEKSRGWFGWTLELFIREV